MEHRQDNWIRSNICTMLAHQITGAEENMYNLRLVTTLQTDHLFEGPSKPSCAQTLYSQKPKTPSSATRPPFNPRISNFSLGIGNNLPFLPASQFHQTPMRGRTPLSPQLRRPPHLMRPSGTRIRFRGLLLAPAAVTIPGVAVVAVDKDVVDWPQRG